MTKNQIIEILVENRELRKQLDGNGSSFNLAVLEDQGQELQKEAERLKGFILNNEVVIDNQRATISALEKDLAERKLAVRNGVDMIQKQKDQIKELEKGYLAEAQKFNNRLEEINRLQELVEKQKNAIMVRDDENKLLRKMVEDRDRQVKSLKRDLADQEQLNATLNQTIKNYQQQQLAQQNKRHKTKNNNYAKRKKVLSRKSK